LRKSKICLLSLTLFLAFFVLAAGPAGASSGYEVLQTPLVDRDSVSSLGTVLCKVRAGALRPGDSVSLRLPPDFQFLKGNRKGQVMSSRDWKVVSTASSVYSNYIEVPDRYAGKKNILSPEDLSVRMLGDNEIMLTVTDISHPDGDGAYFLLHMDRIYIPSSAEKGDIYFTASGPSGTGFPTTDLRVGNVLSGSVNITVLKPISFTDSGKEGSLWLSFEEGSRGSLVRSERSLCLVLPEGFAWQTVHPDDFHLLSGGWGKWGAPQAPRIGTAKEETKYKDGNITKSNDLIIYPNQNELIIKVVNEAVHAASFNLRLGVEVVDEQTAKGELVVRVTGSSGVNPSSLTIGTFSGLKEDASPEETAGGVAVFKVGEQKYIVNGREVAMDISPVAEKGRVFLPARFVANALDIPDSNISWDQDTATVTIVKNGDTVQMSLGSNKILVNGEPIYMDVEPKVLPGRVLIPFRYLAEALGAEVIWDEAEPDTVTLHF
jgi:hypothetical protein